MTEAADCIGPSSNKREAAAEEAAQKATYTKLFQEAGFRDVVLTSCPIPMQVIIWMRDNFGEGQEEQAEAEIEEAKRDTRYFRVTTLRSSFGLFLSHHGALLDLSGTGIDPTEYRKYRTKHRLLSLEGSPFVPFGITGGGNREDNLRRFRHVLLKKRRDSSVEGENTSPESS